ncbi:MAG: hypothetical protein ABI836_02920 [Gemmatimonadota bacterium]
MLAIHADEALILVLVAMVTFLVPVGFMILPVWKRWAWKMEGGGTQDHQLRDEVDELRIRLSELEERLDYSERMLTQVKQTGQLPGEGR